MAICLKTFTTVPMKHDLLYVNYILIFKKREVDVRDLV